MLIPFCSCDITETDRLGVPGMFEVTRAHVDLFAADEMAKASGPKFAAGTDAAVNSVVVTLLGNLGLRS